MLKMFLDSDATSFYPDWEQVARHAVAGFRLLQGRTPDDPRIREVVEELSRRSPVFVEMWERHETRAKRLEIKRFRHREAGDLTLRIHAFDVRSAPGQELVVYQAEPGTRSAEALALLGTLAATQAQEESRSATSGRGSPRATTSASAFRGRPEGRERDGRGVQQPPVSEHPGTCQFDQGS
jgi:hypothetical protein